MSFPEVSFIAELTAYDNKKDERNQSETVVVEIVDTEKGIIELAFNDRNERVYLTFRFTDLVKGLL